MQKEDRIKTEAELVSANETRVIVSNITGWIAAVFTLIGIVCLFLLMFIPLIVVISGMNVSSTLIFSMGIYMGISTLVSVLMGSVLWLVCGMLEANIKSNKFVDSKKMVAICNKVAPYKDLKAKLDHYVNVRPYLTVTEYREFSRESRKMKTSIGDRAYQKQWAEHRRCDVGGSAT